jgi:hypothetical protein
LLSTVKNFMSSTRKFLLSLDVIKEAKALGVSLPNLKDMVVHSTRYTHPVANRRWRDYLFVVKDEIVLSIFTEKIEPEHDEPLGDEGAFYKCWDCKDTGKETVYEECPKCFGKGCTVCGGTGEKIRHIPCQTCSPSQRKYR